MLLKTNWGYIVLLLIQKDKTLLIILRIYTQAHSCILTAKRQHSAAAHRERQQADIYSIGDNRD